ncbi:MAG: ABC transporter ATP-binding protein [Chitinispirillaceae bacterium]|nr:ABC transporter ATP-binding protein [Chitinispirillaceae bacterium]
MAEYLSLRNITKSYGKAVTTRVLENISLSLDQGEYIAIIGQSGSGKSTLLNMIGVLDRPDSGEALFEGKNLYHLTDDDLARFRTETLGFVFQFHHLLPEYSAIENVLLPYRIAHGRVSPEAKKRAEDLLDRVGVAERKHNRSTNLSGGQQQRVALARALMNRPKMILADEPTGNLDSDAGESVTKLLREINREERTTFIIVTHDRHVAASCDRVIEIADGKIMDDIRILGAGDAQAWDRLSPCYCRMRQNEKNCNKSPLSSVLVGTEVFREP